MGRDESQVENWQLRKILFKNVMISSRLVDPRLALTSEKADKCIAQSTI